MIWWEMAGEMTDTHYQDDWVAEEGGGGRGGGCITPSKECGREFVGGVARGRCYPATELWPGSRRDGTLWWQGLMSLTQLMSVI